MAVLARNGGSKSPGYDGERLPGGLRHLSIDGKATRIGSLDDAGYVLLLPAWTGIPDGAVGYAYSATAPTGMTFDCFGDPCRARWSLGDGWYWMDAG